MLRALTRYNGSALDFGETILLAAIERQQSAEPYSTRTPTAFRGSRGSNPDGAGRCFVAMAGRGGQARPMPGGDLLVGAGWRRR